MSAPAASPPDLRGVAWRAGLIVALGLWIYWPALRGGWLWDDHIDIVQNTLLRDPAGWWKPWLAPEGWNFFPLTATVRWLQWQLWGDNTTGYHATNLGLHLLSAMMLWRVLVRLGVREGWLGGLLFVAHPLAVESVAWIAELKNTLSLPLLLASLIAWLDYAERRLGKVYAWSLGLFAAALLAKTSVVAFPGLLLLHAWWRQGCIGWPELRATLPFFAMALGLGLATVAVEHRPATALLELPDLGFWSRLAGAGGALGFYLGKVIFPVGLAPAYPEWSLAAPPARMFLPWIALVVALAAGWHWRATWGRAAIFGAGAYFLSLAPVLGFVPMAYHHIAWVADHFAYLALAVLAGGAAAGASRLPARVWVGVAGVLVVLVLAVSARQHAATFRDEETFWRQAAERQPTAWLPQHNLALLLARTGRSVEAITRYEAAARLKPANSETWNNLGNLLLAQGRETEAIAHYERAVALQPRYPQAWANLGNALLRAGRSAEAATAADKALQVDAGHVPALLLRAEIAVGGRRFEEAARHYAAVVALVPDDAAAKARLVAALVTAGNEHVRAGRATEAKAQYEAALRWQPDDAEVHNNLAFALAQLGRFDDAVRECERALALRPDYPEARENLARLRAMLAGR